MPDDDVAICDWCYVELNPANRNEPLAEVLRPAHAAACNRCVEERRVLRPPDALDPDSITLSGEDAWGLAVAAALSGVGLAPTAKTTLRSIAGYGTEL